MLLHEVVFFIARQPDVKEFLRGTVQLNNELVGRRLLFHVVVAVSVRFFCILFRAVFLLCCLSRNRRKISRTSVLGIRVIFRKLPDRTLVVRPANASSQRTW